MKIAIRVFEVEAPGLDGPYLQARAIMPNSELLVEGSVVARRERGAWSRAIGDVTSWLDQHRPTWPREVVPGVVTLSMARLEAGLARVGEGLTGEPGWQDRVFAALREGEDEYRETVLGQPRIGGPRGAK